MIVSMFDTPLDLAELSCYEFFQVGLFLCQKSKETIDE